MHAEEKHYNFSEFHLMFILMSAWHQILMNKNSIKRNVLIWKNMAADVTKEN